VRIIGVVSGKGGVGKTTLVANLGVALTNFGKSVAAVDCNITTSHLGFCFGFYYYPITLNHVLKGEATLLDATYSHSSGLKIIPASLSVDDLIGVEIEKLKSILSFEGIEIILLDSAPGIGREALSVLNACNEVLFVTIPYINAVADIIRCSSITSQLGIKPLGIVLNMVRNDPHELTKSQVEELARLPVVAKIPFDINIQRSLAVGIPPINYKPNSEASIATMKLAAELIGQSYTPHKGIFSRIYEFFKRI
jgi:septum site-determining protein MinD